MPIDSEALRDIAADRFGHKSVEGDRGRHGILEFQAKPEFADKGKGGTATPFPLPIPLLGPGAGVFLFRKVCGSTETKVRPPVARLKRTRPLLVAKIV